MILLVLAVFASAVALDFASARYQRELARQRRHAAAAWSVAMCLISAVALLAVTKESAWLLLPECAGLYVGTLLAVPAR